MEGFRPKRSLHFPPECWENHLCFRRLTIWCSTFSLWTVAESRESTNHLQLPRRWFCCLRNLAKKSIESWWVSPIFGGSSIFSLNWLAKICKPSKNQKFDVHKTQQQQIIERALFSQSLKLRIKSWSRTGWQPMAMCQEVGLFICIYPSSIGWEDLFTNKVLQVQRVNRLTL